MKVHQYSAASSVNPWFNRFLSSSLIYTEAFYYVFVFPRIVIKIKLFDTENPSNARILSKYTPLIIPCPYPLTTQGNTLCVTNVFLSAFPLFCMITGGQNASWSLVLMRFNSFKNWFVGYMGYLYLIRLSYLICLTRNVLCWCYSLLQCF